MKKRNQGSPADAMADVTLAIVGSTENKEGERVSVIIRAGLASLISKTEYMVCGFDKERLYFKETERLDGYHLVRKNNSDTSYLTFKGSNEFMNWVKAHRGDYDLKHDEQLDLYYIERICWNFKNK